MKIEEILSNQEYQYPDEKIESDLYLISLSTSLRELDSREKQVQEYKDRPMKYEQRLNEYNKVCKNNKWLREECPECEEIPVLALDKIKEYVDREMKSCDGFFYWAQKSETKLSLLIELKNVNKSTMLGYMKARDDNSIYLKVRDSLELISNRLEFEGGYSGKELIGHTHLLLVYGGRADMVSSGNIHFGEKAAAKKNEKGRQARAVPIRKPSFDDTKTIQDSFGEKVKKMGLASCPFKYFGFPGREPREIKEAQGKVRTYTIFSKEDMRKAIEDCAFFDNWDWGKYSSWFDNGEGHVDE